MFGFEIILKLRETLTPISLINRSFSPLPVTWFLAACVKSRLTKRRVCNSSARHWNIIALLKQHSTSNRATNWSKRRVCTLPEQQKRVYTLSRLEGKSHQEISDLLHTSISTVNNLMVKANKEVCAFLYRRGDLVVLVAATTLFHSLM
jgi:hypothetical protein